MKWFKLFPFLIVAINILIAVVSDFESGVRGMMAMAEYGDRWWLSSENVWLYGGWWNWVNGISGLINIFCMTGWLGIYVSKDKKDMLWPDMTWCFILAYDLWNFEYTYNNLPTHAWYCGLALLLALPLPMLFGIKAAGYRTELIGFMVYVCRYFRCFRMPADLPLYRYCMQTDLWMNCPTRPAAANPTMQGVVAVITDCQCCMYGNDYQTCKNSRRKIHINMRFLQTRRTLNWLWKEQRDKKEKLLYE